MVDAHELVETMQSTLDTYQRVIQEGSRYVGGKHPAWYYDTQSRIFHKPNDYTDASPQLRVSTLKDGTFDLRDGQFQLRRQPNGDWLYRHGREEWQEVGL